MNETKRKWKMKQSGRGYCCYQAFILSDVYLQALYNVKNISSLDVSDTIYDMLLGCLQQLFHIFFQILEQAEPTEFEGGCLQDIQKSPLSHCQVNSIATTESNLAKILFYIAILMLYLTTYLTQQKYTCMVRYEKCAFFRF